MSFAVVAGARMPFLDDGATKSGTVLAGGWEHMVRGSNEERVGVMWGRSVKGGRKGKERGQRQQSLSGPMDL